MGECQTYSTESFILNWNTDFPKYPLKLDDLKKPQTVMGALFLIFDKLGIDKDFVLAAPPEEICNESISYYWDLVPVINMTRVVNQLVSIMPQIHGTVSIMHFMQPTLTISKSILLLLYNLMLFNEARLNQIAPDEEALFKKTEHLKTLETTKTKLMELLNKQAEERGDRAERLEKLAPDVKQFEEELKQEKEVHDDEKQKLEPILKENHQTELLADQKKSQRDTLMAEVAKKKDLRVYDADDIKAQAEQAAQNVQEAEEKLNSLQATLVKKENCLTNLQTIKPNLDTANNTLHEIMKLHDTLKDLESGDLDSDSKEDELAVLNTELSELQVQLSELQAARAEAGELRLKNEAKRQIEIEQTLSELREAEENDKNTRARYKEEEQRIEEIKQLIVMFEEEKSADLEELAAIKNSFCNGIKSVEDALIKKLMETEKRVKEELNKRKL